MSDFFREVKTCVNQSQQAIWPNATVIPLPDTASEVDLVFAGAEAPEERQDEPEAVPGQEGQG